MVRFLARSSGNSAEKQRTSWRMWMRSRTRGEIVVPWHLVLRRLVEAVDQASLTAVPLHTSLPVDSWPTSRVTLLGDAIHTMTPLQGLGDNTGDRRRAAPPHQLSEANRGEKPLLSPVAEYEQAMRRGGFKAVAQVTAIFNAVASRKVAARLAFRAMLRVTDRIPRLRRALFQRPIAGLPRNQKRLRARKPEPRHRAASRTNCRARLAERAASDRQLLRGVTRAGSLRLGLAPPS